MSGLNFIILYVNAAFYASLLGNCVPGASS